MTVLENQYFRLLSLLSYSYIFNADSWQFGAKYYLLFNFRAISRIYIGKNCLRYGVCVFGGYWVQDKAGQPQGVAPASYFPIKNTVKPYRVFYLRKRLFLLNI